ERLVFPGLHVACRPVVEQAQAEHVSIGVADGDRFAGGVAGADPDSDLELVVEAARRDDDRLFGALRADLPAWTTEPLPADVDRRCPAVIADRNPLVVRQQRLVGAEL